MSDVLLWIIIVILVILLSILLYKYRQQVRQIKKIDLELKEHIISSNQENILLITDHKPLQELLVRINLLIDREKELERKQRKREDSNRKMLANISHDLKTPLTVIMGYAEMLQNEDIELDVKSRLRIDKINNKASDVLVMIEEFFDVVKIEAGDFTLNIESLDICELCREEVLQYYELIEDLKIDLEFDLSDISIFVEADRIALKRILSNLISNAVRHGADGRYLKIKTYQNDNHKYIEVIDHGKGIIEDHQDKIFERLFTLEDSRNKKYQGSGLGLTVTKRLVEAMDGRITLTSIPYKETRFIVEF
ncbi:MAG: sensor histidine kinase [Lachnospiraceae bacterium]